MSDDDKKPGEKQPEETPPDGGGTTPPADETIFTQADLNKLAKKERGRGKQQAQTEMLAELGVESADDAKAALKELADLKASQMTEAEKQKVDLEAMRQELADEKAASADAVEKANSVLKRAAVMTEAAKPDHKIHADAMADVWAFVDQDLLTVNEAGDVEGAEDAVKAVLKERAYLVGGQTAGPATPRREPNSRQPQQQPTEAKRPTVRL